MSKSRETPTIFMQPPLIFFSAIILGAVMNRFVATSLFPLLVRLGAGIPVTLVSLCLSALTFREFNKYDASIDYKKPPKLIITTGPFRLSRNPLYLSGIMLVLGAGLILNSLWVIGMLIPSIFLVRYGAIQCEERCLHDRFGAEYERYSSSVRRWI